MAGMFDHDHDYDDDDDNDDDNDDDDFGDYWIYVKGWRKQLK